MKPEVGIGATINFYSDRSPATIISVSKTGKKIFLQKDSYTRLDNNGMSEVQQYSFDRNLNGEIIAATLRKDGKYRVTGTNEIVIVGVRDRYYDYSF